ncbi:MAG TPA: hypothetical protein VJO16_14990 [Candidatus Acidoferrum sp.]|nr:hypothetical protein [Candidatus Acidoferrum sp.]
MEGQVINASLPEPLLTVAEVATLMKVSATFVRRTFEDEPGVVRLGHSANGKRRYLTLRIPRLVFERVITRMSRL